MPLFSISDVFSCGSVLTLAGAMVRIRPWGKEYDVTALTTADRFWKLFEQGCEIIWEQTVSFAPTPLVRAPKQYCDHGLEWTQSYSASIGQLSKLLSEKLA